jgi:hypothetical protein
VYTAVILTAGRTWHVAAGSAAQVIQQVAAVLACLGVPQGRCSLLFLADGAGWIRAWFSNLPVANKAMIWQSPALRLGFALGTVTEPR